MRKWIKGLGLTFPTKKETIALTAVTAWLMLAGGAILFLIDAACIYLFALVG